MTAANQGVSWVGPNEALQINKLCAASYYYHNLHGIRKCSYMPRANRYWVKGAAYHLTHRCHDRSFLLDEPSDRDAYCNLLRVRLADGDVSLLGYTITSNHIHLLVTAARAEDTARLMQRVQGEFAADYNQRHGRRGAFWSDRYHATMIDGGIHLVSCLKYIDLNMVRAGVVTHPREWPWTSWHELTGSTSSATMINVEVLLARLPNQSVESFRKYYRSEIDLAVTTEVKTIRDTSWTRSLAIGSLPFVQHIERELDLESKRCEMDREIRSDGAWILRETKSTSYGAADYKNANTPTHL